MHVTIVQLDFKLFFVNLMRSISFVMPIDSLNAPAWCRLCEKLIACGQLGESVSLKNYHDFDGSRVYLVLPSYASMTKFGTEPKFDIY